jgi:hypothetical protein
MMMRHHGEYITNGLREHPWHYPSQYFPRNLSIADVSHGMQHMVIGTVMKMHCTCMGGGVDAKENTLRKPCQVETWEI